MENIIYAYKLFTNGLTESNGLILRDKIEELIKKEERIVIDFEKITLFATPFFNASIGYFVLKLGPEKFNQKFELINMTKLCEDTFNHSYNNAVESYSKKINLEEVGEITKKNIENS